MKKDNQKVHSNEVNEAWRDLSAAAITLEKLTEESAQAELELERARLRLWELNQDPKRVRESESVPQRALEVGNLRREYQDAERQLIESIVSGRDQPDAELNKVQSAATALLDKGEDPFGTDPLFLDPERIREAIYWASWWKRHFPDLTYLPKAFLNNNQPKPKWVIPFDPEAPFQLLFPEARWDKTHSPYVGPGNYRYEDNPTYASGLISPPFGVPSWFGLLVPSLSEAERDSARDPRKLKIWEARNLCVKHHPGSSTLNYINAGGNFYTTLDVPDGNFYLNVKSVCHMVGGTFSERDLNDPYYTIYKVELTHRHQVRIMQRTPNDRYLGSLTNLNEAPSTVDSWIQGVEAGTPFHQFIAGQPPQSGVAPVSTNEQSVSVSGPCIIRVYEGFQYRMFIFAAAGQKPHVNCYDLSGLFEPLTWELQPE